MIKINVDNGKGEIALIGESEELAYEFNCVIKEIAKRDKVIISGIYLTLIDIFGAEKAENLFLKEVENEYHNNCRKNNKKARNKNYKFGKRNM